MIIIKRDGREVDYNLSLIHIQMCIRDRCCEGLFIKNGNRQKYCDHPECKKERNRRKSKMAYHRRQKEDKNAEWAQEKMEESRND